MVKGLWGKKVGMTQLFVNDKVVPATAIDVSDWLVTAIKSEKMDGYNAVQFGCLRKRFSGQSFTPNWLKDKKTFFGHVREVRLDNLVEDIKVGKSIDFTKILDLGIKVDVSGETIGRGFAGVMKRHNFTGGPSAHGSMFKRRPGSIGFLCACGKVIKGKRMAGHMGCQRQTMRNLEVVRVEPEKNVVFVKGSVPGKTGSVVFVRKCR
ncbi:MAG: 50S ribosomal protein L3 [candidate division TM6 bacterium GW2011_GWF2_32_72]|nr:MAG: 50S ribosomal protein L3 [candidate division TM6 bacterium GW2011_GWF2_32_72]